MLNAVIFHFGPHKKKLFFELAKSRKKSPYGPIIPIPSRQSLRRTDTF